MIVHEMKLHDNGFYRMKSGIKRVEVRLFDEKRRKIAIGDHIMFTNTENPKEQLSTKVT
ncbi:hypothetical protein KBC03_00485 [Patescibacteria group bacterium]|nr:hypothetical protein [Patescibacteria group bacterium]